MKMENIRVILTRDMQTRLVDSQIGEYVAGPLLSPSLYCDEKGIFLLKAFSNQRCALYFGKTRGDIAETSGTLLKGFHDSQAYSLNQEQLEEMLNFLYAIRTISRNEKRGIERYLQNRGNGNREILIPIERAEQLDSVIKSLKLKVT
jgi:hypothetical protein